MFPYQIFFAATCTFKLADFNHHYKILKKPQYRVQLDIKMYADTVPCHNYQIPYSLLVSIENNKQLG